MKLRELYIAQQGGALKVSKEKNKIGTIEVTPEQRKMFIQSIGWKTWDRNDWEIISRTGTIIKGLCQELSDLLLDNTEVTFMNRRLTNTIKYFDRIQLVNPWFNFVILHGMPGTGGGYAVYDADVPGSSPIENCRTLKSLSEFINSTVEEG